MLNRQESEESSDAQNKANVELLEGKHMSKGPCTQKVPADSWETSFQLDIWALRIEKIAWGLQKRYLHKLEPQRLFTTNKENKKSDTEKSRLTEKRQNKMI